MYLINILKIVYRWRPPLPLGKTPFISSVVDDSLFIYIISFPIGLAHAAKQDGELNGMLIPGGSLIMPNIW